MKIETPFFLGIPSAPLNASFSPQSLTSTVLCWTPSDADCIVAYTITLTNITEGNASYAYNVTTNTTSMTVSDLTQGVVYSFTVAGVNIGGRVGEKSLTSEELTFDGKELKIIWLEERFVLYYYLEFIFCFTSSACTVS